MVDENSASTASPEAISETVVDIVIIGAGIAGSTAAALLARQGYDCALISMHEHFPPDFRAEKIGEPQMQVLDRGGLGAVARAASVRFEGAWLHRFGYLAERGTDIEYACDYADLMNAIRTALPEAVRFIVGKVREIETSETDQAVTLADGRRIVARLVVIATGLVDAVRRMVGIEREVVSPAHSVSYGFDMTYPEDGLPFPSLVWSDVTFGERLSYLTLFPYRDRIRANLFAYRSITDEWTEAFKARPDETLAATIPGLEALLGKSRITGPVVARPVDVIDVRNHIRPGVVVVGDAFKTVCPITGTGVDKALTDVVQLCDVHIPAWFKTPGMGADKIARYYADPVKVARDRSARRMTLDSKSIKLDPSPYWTYRRLRSQTLGRARLMLRSILRSLLPHKDSASTKA